MLAALLVSVVAHAQTQDIDWPHVLRPKYLEEESRCADYPYASVSFELKGIHSTVTILKALLGKTHTKELNKLSRFIVEARHWLQHGRPDKAKLSIDRIHRVLDEIERKLAKR